MAGKHKIRVEYSGDNYVQADVTKVGNKTIISRFTFGNLSYERIVGVFAFIIVGGAILNFVHEWTSELLQNYVFPHIGIIGLIIAILAVVFAIMLDKQRSATSLIGNILTGGVIIGVSYHFSTLEFNGETFVGWVVALIPVAVYVFVVFLTPFIFCFLLPKSSPSAFDTGMIGCTFILIMTFLFLMFGDYEGQIVDMPFYQMIIIVPVTAVAYAIGSLLCAVPAFLFYKLCSAVFHRKKKNIEK